MKTVFLIVPFLLAMALVVYTEGSFNGFTVWNVLPIVAGLGVLLAARRAGLADMVGCAAFAVSAMLLMVLFHLSWFFDWGGTATGSSTSALAFIFVPLWVYMISGIVGLMAWGITWLVRRNRVARQIVS